jgi:hypothetical protein
MSRMRDTSLAGSPGCCWWIPLTCGYKLSTRGLYSSILVSM